jgi:hypothetical protein
MKGTASFPQPEFCLLPQNNTISSTYSRRA